MTTHSHHRAARPWPRYLTRVKPLKPDRRVLGTTVATTQRHTSGMSPSTIIVIATPEGGGLRRNACRTAPGPGGKPPSTIVEALCEVNTDSNVSYGYNCNYTRSDSGNASLLGDLECWGTAAEPRLRQ